MKKFNGLSKGFMSVATVACLLFAAGVTGVPYYGSVGTEAVGVAKKANKANKTKKISADKAKKIALGDAKLAEKDVTFVKVELEFEDNRLVYDVEFYSGNVEYDYDIDAVSGEIISNDFDIEDYSIPAQSAAAPQQTEAPKQTAAAPAPTTQAAKNPSGDIGMERAKQIALSHAGLSQGSVSFVKAQLDYEDGVKVYEIEFYSGNVEYDYDIDAVSGDIISNDFDIENYSIPVQPTEVQQTNADTVDIGVEKAKEIALSHAGHSLDKVSFVKAEIDYEDGIKVYDIDFYSGNVEYDYEIDAVSGSILSADRDIENYVIPTQPSTAAANTQSSEISVEKAKQIALSHAGVGGANFTKAELDTDDGVQVYEIEFKVGNVEYEYDINAISGAIISSKSEVDD